MELSLRNLWRYHTTAYVSYLQVSSDQVSIHKGRDVIKKCMSTCQSQVMETDVVEQWSCDECSSKLLSVPVSSVSAGSVTGDNNTNRGCWVNLGSLDKEFQNHILLNGGNN